MNNATEAKMIVGLDIGTSKVVAIVGAVTPEGEIDIIGIGSHMSRGLKKGVVVNIESTVQSIQIHLRHHIRARERNACSATILSLKGWRTPIIS